MPFNTDLLERIEHLVRQRYPSLEQKRMFGGVGFFRDGNYAFGASVALVVRVGPTYYADALAQPYARVMDVTGRPMRGWVFVDLDGLPDDEALTAWLDRGYSFAGTLPPKQKA